MLQTLRKNTLENNGKIKILKRNKNIQKNRLPVKTVAWVNIIFKISHNQNNITTKL